MSAGCAPQLALAQKNGYAVEIHDALKVLEGHQPQPSLLHGDLWSGNAGFIDGGAGAVRSGGVLRRSRGGSRDDRAIRRISARVLRGVRRGWPLDAGYEKRKHLYNLYHLLNHLNLFGGGYLAQVKRRDRYAFWLLRSSSFCSSPDWYISRMMSEPPTNSPLT